MKASGIEAARRLAAEADPGRAGILLYGAEAMLVALARQELVAALVGPEGEAEMRLDRLAAADLRRDPAAVADAVRARGFFPGPRVVLVEGATDAVSGPILDALAGRREGDALLVVTAGALPARSGLRKGFEASRAAVSVALYPDPPGRGEVEQALARAGVAAASAEAVEALVALGAELDRGAFDRLVETLALYLHGSAAPAGAEDVAAVAPADLGGDVDDLIDAVAEGRTGQVPLQIGRLAARGTAPSTILIAAIRHLRALHAAAASGDPEQGLGRAGPPVYGPRRSRMAAQARRLGTLGAERALRLVTDTELTLRSPGRRPDMALVERCLIRISTLAR